MSQALLATYSKSQLQEMIAIATVEGYATAHRHNRIMIARDTMEKVTGDHYTELGKQVKYMLDAHCLIKRVTVKQKVAAITTATGGDQLARIPLSHNAVDAISALLIKVADPRVAANITQSLAAAKDTALKAKKQAAIAKAKARIEMLSL